MDLHSCGVTYSVKSHMHHGLEQISWGESGGGQRRAGNILSHALLRIHPKLFGSAIWHRSLLQTSDQGLGALLQTADHGDERSPGLAE